MHIKLRQEVEIQAFCNEETKKLDENYDITTYDSSEVKSGTLGSWEKEEIARRLLGYSTQASKIVAITLDDFTREAPTDDPFHFSMYGSKGNLKDLLEQGYLNLDIEGLKAIIYPTEKLLDNQGVERRTKTRADAAR